MKSIVGYLISSPGIQIYLGCVCMYVSKRQESEHGIWICFADFYKVEELHVWYLLLSLD